jgi:hypothetical protein
MKVLEPYADSTVVYLHPLNFPVRESSRSNIASPFYPPP